MDENKISRIKVLPGFLAMMGLAAVVYIGMTLIQPSLMGSTALFDWAGLMAGCTEGTLLWRLIWIIIDFSQGTFMASVIGTGTLLIGLIIAVRLSKKGSAHMGTGVDGNQNIMLKMVICAFLGLAFSQVVAAVCGAIGGANPFATYGWIPTFAVFISVQVLMIFHGTTPAKMITIVILSPILTYLASLAVLKFLVVPVGLPLFCCVAYGLMISIPVTQEILRVLPWTKNPDPAPAVAEAPAAEAPAPVVHSENHFFIHRTFGDIGELVVWGSSIAAILMYVGCIINWFINPLNVGYSAGNFGMLIAGQIATSALAVFIYYPRWKKNGWTFTFGGIIFTTAILVTYANHWVIVASTILIGALVFGPLIDFLLKTLNKNGRFHPIVFIQMAVGTGTMLWAFAIKFCLYPLLGIA